MTTLATDTFDRGNETPLASPWVQVATETTMNLDTNVVVPANLGSNTAYRRGGISWPDNQYSQAKLSSTGVSVGSGPGVAVRMSGSGATATMYAVFATNDGLGGWDAVAFRVNNNSYNQLTTGWDSETGWTNGDTVRLEITGSGASTLLKLFRNGSQVGSDFTDASGNISSGDAGIAYSSTVTTASINDWEGGDFGAGGATISVPNASLSVTGESGATQIYQVAVPVSEVTDGAWLPSSGADLYATLDDDSDADYDYVASNSTMEVKFASLTDPAVSSGHTLNYRIKGNGAATITVYLVQGSSPGTVIATYSHVAEPAVLATYTRTLTGGEADSITDYTDLRIRVTTSA